MTSLAVSAPLAELDDLADVLTGRLVRPGDPNWDEARRAWSLSVDQTPAAVVLAEDVGDVVATVALARVLGLRVAPQATGHAAAPMGDLADTVLLKTSAMRGVEIDAGARVARAEAGALWMDVTDAAAPFGLAALAGSSRDVGVAGYTLGGGLSWLGRSHGLAANSVLALEVVTADGEVRRIDADSDPELFWALRGGGGSFAIVTALEFRLYPITEVYAGNLFFPIEQAATVLNAWREWTDTVPDTVTSVGRVLRFPPLPQVPEPLRGRSFVVLGACCQLAEQDAAGLLAPLRGLGPVMDTFAATPVAELGHLHMDPDGPVPAFGDGMLLGPLSAAAVDALVGAVRSDTGASLLAAELRHLGGALRPGAASGGAVSGLDGAFALFAVGMTPTPEAAAAVHAAVGAVQDALAPWATGAVYQNFAEGPRPARVLFPAEAYPRLRAVKAAYDPTDLVRANHPVDPDLGD